MHDLTGFQRDLLVTIAGLEEPTGVAIKEAIERYYRKEIKAGHIYPYLDSLVERGLVNKEQHDGRTNVYILTSAGRRALEERRKWETAYLE